MIIHVVELGETVRSISDYYGISQDWLVRENGIADPSNLAVGSTLVILYPLRTHTIVQGDTLENIANMYEVTIMDLLRNNSYLADIEYLPVGDVLVVEYEDVRQDNLMVVGYCYPFIEEKVLKKTLPYLTYVMIYSYIIGSEGNFNALNDRLIIEYAKTYGVAPIMVLSIDTSEDTSATEIANEVLNDETLSSNLKDHIISTLIEKGYAGLSLVPIYVYPSDRQLYVEFFTELTNSVKELGLTMFDTFVPTIFDLISNIFATQDYIRIINELLDYIIVFPSAIGTVLGTPFGIANYNTILDQTDYILKFNDNEEVLIGINITGYMWELPYIPGVSSVNTISVASARQLAADYNIPIQFDERTRLAYYIYSELNREYLVRFSDARTIISFLEVVNDKELKGLGNWNIMSFFNNLWLIVNSQYFIDKVEI